MVLSIFEVTHPFQNLRKQMDSFLRKTHKYPEFCIPFVDFKGPFDPTLEF